MRKWMAALAVAAIAALGGASGPQAEAQGLVTLVRTYAQQGYEGCYTQVAQWSDGSYTVVPWICPPGAVPLRNDRPVPAIRSYQEQERTGCVYFVTLWADAIYTAVPQWCPYGVIPVKPGTTPDPGFAVITGPAIPWNSGPGYYGGATPYGNQPYGGVPYYGGARY